MLRMPEVVAMMLAEQVAQEVAERVAQEVAPPVPQTQAEVVVDHMPMGILAALVDQAQY
jgi:hypothetical protein